MNFEEKPQTKKGWINGGFFILNKKIFKYFSNKNEMFEKSPIKKLTKNKQLIGFKHFNFWHCMDTPRDKEYLQKLIKTKKAPWLK